MARAGPGVSSEGERLRFLCSVRSGQACFHASAMVGQQTCLMLKSLEPIKQAGQDLAPGEGRREEGGHADFPFWNASATTLVLVSTFLLMPLSFGHKNPVKGDQTDWEIKGRGGCWAFGFYLKWWFADGSNFPHPVSTPGAHVASVTTILWAEAKDIAKQCPGQPSTQRLIQPQKSTVM